jgi:RNA-binding protein YlmH
MDKQLLLRSFETDEERLVFSRLYDLFCAAVKNNKPVFSSFLDPVSISRCGRIFEHNLPPFFVMKIFGGAPNSERQMICFSPQPDNEADLVFPVSCLEITYNKKFSKKLSHRDFLGSVLALGIERKKIGDITVLEAGALVYVVSDMADYIIYNLERAGNTPVKVKLAGIEGADVQEEQTGREIRKTVSSLRIDAVISACLKLSRADAAALVEAEKVFVNWKLANKASKLAQEGETITVRGYGRIVIKGIVGRSKKDKLVINVWVS